MIRMWKNTAVATTWVAVTAISLNSLPVVGAETPNLAALVAQQQAPKVELPPLPVDGSGYHRLSLNGAIGAAPLVVMLEVKGTQVVKAVALPIHNTRVPWPVDSAKLVVKDGKITGELKVDAMTECGTHPERLKIPRDPQRAMAVDYKLKPQVTGTVTLDVDCQGARGTGTYSTVWSDGAFPINVQVKAVEKGGVTVLREAFRSLPETCDVELQMYAGMGDMTPSPCTVVRARLTKGGLTDLRGYITQSGAREKPMKVTQSELNLRDGRLTGRIEGEEGKPFTLEIAGEAIGRQLYGTVTCVDGETRVTTTWVGQLHDVSEWRLPLDYPRNEWTWQHDLPADPALTNQAAQEALIPVLPGKPGKTKFWTWRPLAMDRAASCIHPPSFDIQEVEGASQYRFCLTGFKDDQGNEAALGQKAECVQDKPWRPLTPVWKDLKLGAYHLVVTPLAADGTPIAGKMRVNIIERGERYGTNAVGWVTKEMDKIALIKRPSFQGPYSTPLVTSWRDLALECARWERDGAPIPEAPWSLSGGKSPFVWAWTGASQVWGNLAARSFTTDPAERAISEAALAYLAGETVLHQAMHGGMINDYKSYTVVSHFLVGATLDVVVQTGDPQWREIVLTYARALVRLQNDNGSFGSLKGKGTPPGGGWADWPAGNPEFGASELLYTLGRIRRDLKTDEFVGAEKKALGWMKNRAIPERFFPLYVHHSASQAYPVTQHPISALMFARYLLELAPAEERNVKLAEECARWAEDYGINWTRRSEGSQKGQITPFIPAGDRINCDPAPANMLAAIVFEQLSRETGDTLWSAKAEALATAVTLAREPALGYLKTSLRSTWYLKIEFFTSNYDNGVAGRGWATQLMREYDVLMAER